MAGAARENRRGIDAAAADQTGECMRIRPLVCNVPCSWLAGWLGVAFLCNLEALPERRLPQSVVSFAGVDFCACSRRLRQDGFYLSKLMPVCVLFPSCCATPASMPTCTSRSTLFCWLLQNLARAILFLDSCCSALLGLLYISSLMEFGSASFNKIRFETTSHGIVEVGMMESSRVPQRIFVFERCVHTSQCVK